MCVFLRGRFLSLPTLLGKNINKNKTILNELSELVNAESERNEMKNNTNTKHSITQRNKHIHIEECKIH